MRIFYFSGTGNSLYAAKRVRDILGEGRVRAISDASRRGEFMVEEEVIGFAFPAYSLSLPRPVAEFASRLTAKGRPYVFALATHNGKPGLANRGLARALSPSGMELAAGFELLMPGNSVILKDYTNPPEERRRRLEQAEIGIESIARSIRDRERVPYRRSIPSSDSFGSLLTSLGRKLYRLPRHFRADGKCTRCGTCARVCPRANIRVGERVSWGRDCAECLACFHWCPAQAVQIGSYTEGSLRYQHPEVGIREMYGERS